MAVTKRRNNDVLLGAFVCMGIVITMVAIFLIGKENHLFDRSAHINAYFENVSGLGVGADVMIAGVLVGYVDQIGFPGFYKQSAQSFGKIKVVIRLPYNKLPWLRTDSIARIDSKGLLGDKIINMSLGSPGRPELVDQDTVKTMESLDLSTAMEKAEDVLQHVTEAVQLVQDFMKSFTAQGGDQSLVAIAKSLESIMKAVETGPGLLNRLIFSKQAADDFENSIAGIDQILRSVQRGPSLIHSLAFDPKGAELLDNLSAMAQGTKEGQGTMGRLLNDPSLYDEMKLLLGNVRRNEILKGLIRYSLRQKELMVERQP